MVDHVAEGEGAALAGGGALAVDTGLAGVTLRVRATALTGQTLDIGVAQESGQAATVGAVVDGNALGILAARILLAGIDAAAVEAIAELRRWTVLVVLADMGACWLAANKSVALEAIGAAAIGRVVGVDANGIRGARIMDIAGMLAALVDARLRDATV